MVFIKKKICILGLGYIGLPTAAMFATHGHHIVGVDVSSRIVDSLNRGEITIEEPYLDPMVREAVSSGYLKASTVPEQADAYIIAVGTPINGDKTADLTAVIGAAESIVRLLKKGDLVILESTCPPGTVTDLLVPILSKSGLDIGTEVLVAHCPERVLPGRILLELVENNKIVGGVNSASCEAVRDLYRSFVKGEIYLTDATTAEMCKLMENTYRDVNIALANETAMICENLGIDAWEVIKLSNKHPRVHLHSPGPGVGGHCLAVDPWFIVEKQPELSNIIRLARETNDGMPEHIYSLVKKILSRYSGIQKTAVLGVTYKPNIDDIRESPIIELIDILRKDPAVTTAVFDPHAKKYAGAEPDLYKAAEKSSLVILAVNHDEFSHIDFDRLKSVMSHANILDTRNSMDEKTLKEAGFEYFLLGKGKMTD